MILTIQMYSNMAAIIPIELGLIWMITPKS